MFTICLPLAVAALPPAPRFKIRPFGSRPKQTLRNGELPFPAVECRWRLLGFER